MTSLFHQELRIKKLPWEKKEKSGFGILSAKIFCSNPFLAPQTEVQKYDGKGYAQFARYTLRCVGLTYVLA